MSNSIRSIGQPLLTFRERAFTVPDSGLPPLVLTLMLHPAAQAHFDGLRSTYGSTDRLIVGPHITLFHRLPGTLSVMAAIAAEAHEQTPALAQVTGVRFLGRGVALDLRADRLSLMRQHMRDVWEPRLSAQDREPWQPHVTIQSNVEPALAKDLHATLAARFVPFEVTITGLALWINRGGPWQAAGEFPFIKAGP